MTLRPFAEVQALVKEGNVTHVIDGRVFQYLKDEDVYAIDVTGPPYKRIYVQAENVRKK